MQESRKSHANNVTRGLEKVPLSCYWTAHSLRSRFCVLPEDFVGDGERDEVTLISKSGGLDSASPSGPRLFSLDNFRVASTCAQLNWPQLTSVAELQKLALCWRGMLSFRVLRTYGIRHARSACLMPPHLLIILLVNSPYIGSAFAAFKNEPLDEKLVKIVGKSVDARHDSRRIEHHLLGGFYLVLQAA